MGGGAFPQPGRLAKPNDNARLITLMVDEPNLRRAAGWEFSSMRGIPVTRAVNHVSQWF